MDNKIFLRQIRNQKKHWWFQARKKIIDEIIFEINFKKKINILDFGSGSGVNIDILQKYGEVDIQEKNKKIDKKKVTEIVNLVFNEMSDTLKKGNEVKISDFGIFSLTENVEQPITKFTLKNKRKVWLKNKEDKE